MKKVACVMVCSILSAYNYFRHYYFVDIDECIAERPPCGNDQVCVNSRGSYLCACNVGYVYNVLRETCEGIKY